MVNKVERIKFNKSSTIMKLIINILILYTFLLILLVQLQMEFMGRAIIRDSVYKLLILFLIIIYLIINKRIKIYKVDLLSSLYILATTYIFIDIFFMTIYNSKSINVIFDLFGVYFPIIIGCFFVNIKEKINIKKIIKISIFFCFINLIIAFFQEYFQSLLFKYQYDQVGNAIFNSINFITENSRRVGMTSSGYNLGLILVFFLVFSVGIIIDNEKKIVRKRGKYLVLIPLIVMGILLTKTRNIYFFAIYSFLFIIISYKLKIFKKIFMITCPIIMPIMYYSFLYFISNNNSINNNIYSSGTFNVRLNVATEAINIIKQSSIVNILLGTGQRELYDNVLLLWMNDLGIIGMSVLIVVVAVTYYKLINIEKVDIISYILGTYLSAFFIIGLLNIFPIEYYFFSIILSIIWIRQRQYYN